MLDSVCEDRLEDDAGLWGCAVRQGRGHTDMGHDTEPIEDVRDYDAGQNMSDDKLGDGHVEPDTRAGVPAAWLAVRAAGGHDAGIADVSLWVSADGQGGGRVEPGLRAGRHVDGLDMRAGRYEHDLRVQAQGCVHVADHGQADAWLEVGAGGRGGGLGGRLDIGVGKDDSRLAARRKSVGEIVTVFEKLKVQKTGAYRTVWKKNDDNVVRYLAKNLTKRKWDIVKLCLEIVEENNIIVKELKITDMKKMNIEWSEDDASKVMLKCLE